MHVARAGLGVGVVDGKIYAIGGFVANGVATGANEVYDPATDTWETKSSMPTLRPYFALAVYKGKIYCIGSTGGTNEVYDPVTDTWETRASMPTPRAYIKGNVVNGKIYVIGGFVSDGSGSGGGSRLDVNEVYDPETNSWTTKTPMPTAGLGHISAVVDNKIYITDSNRKNQIYDVETDTWSLGAPPPEYIGSGAAAATTGVNALKRIYILTEHYGEARFNQVYDPKNDGWKTGTFMPTYRRNFGVAVMDDLIYVIGGYTMKRVDISEYIKTGEMYEYIFYATNEQYVPFGYGTPDPSYDGTAPEVTVTSPQNKTYYTTDITLNFTVNEPVSLIRYELDGENATEIAGNTTLTELSYGAHNLTVYATDASGNTGTSETICFTVAEEPPFPTVLVATASGASATIIAIGLLVYFKKLKH
jgi:N-acetylneuraminic acid mutarotase